MTIIDQIVNVANSTNSASEECFIWKLIPAVVSGLITFGITYYMFTEKERKDKEKEEARLNDIRDLFYETFKKFMEGITLQIVIIEKNINQLKDDRKKSISIFRPSDFALKVYPDEILEISKKDTFKFLIQNHLDNKEERIDNYSDFYTRTSFISHIMKQYEEEHKRYFQNYENALRKLDELKFTILDRVNKKRQESFQNGKTLQQHAPFYNEISEIYLKYLPKADGTLDPTNKYFFTLIIELVNSTKHLAEIDSIAIFNLCKNAKDIYDRIILDDKRIDQVNKESWLKEFKDIRSVIIKLKELEFQDKVDTKNVFFTKQIILN